MPKKMEQRLRREAKKKGFSPARAGAYVYGSMRNKGWKPKHERKGSK